MDAISGNGEISSLIKIKKKKTVIYNLGSVGSFTF
jgi:hypothetical protein